MNKSELLAKMGARSQSLTIGSGGKPLVTWTDVSGALSFVEDKFCMEMFNLIDGPTLRSWPRCDALIETRQFWEWRSRAERFVAAQLAEAAARRDLSWRGVLHAELMLQGTKAALWQPLRAPQWAHIRASVVSELRGRPLCVVCEGKREVLNDQRPTKCAACDGLGRERISERRRAENIGIDISNYLRNWRTVYEWTYNLVSDSALVGRSQFNPATE